MVDELLPEYTEKVIHKPIQNSVDPKGRIHQFISRTVRSREISTDSDEILFQKALIELQRQKDLQGQMLARERILLNVLSRISESLDFEKLMTTTVTEVRQMLQADRVIILKVSVQTEDDKSQFLAESVAPEFNSILDRIREDNSTSKCILDCFITPSLNAFKDGRILLIPDVQVWSAQSQYSQLIDELKIYSSFIFPLFREQNLWGVLFVHQCSGVRQWRPTDIEMMSRIALPLDVALQQAELLLETKAQSLELQRVLKEVKNQKAELAQVALQERAYSYVIRRMRHSLDVDQIFRVTTQEVREILNCDRVVVYRFLPDWSGELIHESADLRWKPFISAHQSTPWIDTYLQEHQGGRFQNLESIVTPDVYEANFSDCHLDKLKEHQIRASMIVPVFIGETLWGLLSAYQHLGPRDWQSRELRFLEQVGDQLGVALQQAYLLKQLTQAEESANAANQAKTTFLANMSHELRTPLNTILGFTQLMSRDHNTTSDQRDTLDIINRSGAHLLNIINDVLEMSKIESGNTTFNPRDFDLYGMLENLREIFSFKVQGKGLDLIFDCESSVPRYVRGDEGKLSQILMNLLGNAIKFTEKGHVALNIKLKPQDSSNTGIELPPIWLDFEVEDTGAGIAATEIETIFDAFAQTTIGRQATEGTGLGLTISRHFIQLMGGEITVVSQVNQGTKVQFSIQVNEAAFVETPLLPDRRVVSLAPNQSTYRILVVEDHPENRQLMLRLLSSVGFEVRAVSNGIEAVAQWCTWCPHLIWMDWQMPVMNGFDATQQIRHLELLRDSQNTRDEDRKTFNGLHIPSANAFSPISKTVIIALTASVFEETRLEALQAGCNSFMRKPFQENELLEQMVELLGVRYLYDLPEKEDVFLDSLRQDDGFDLPVIKDAFLEDIPEQEDSLLDTMPNASVRSTGIEART